MVTSMHKLSKQHCQACQADAPLISADQAQELLTDLPGWSRLLDNGIEKLIKEYKFNSFRQALKFTNSVGELAENENHHPTLITEWGKVTVYWWTHKIKGLHMNDFIMAAKSDQLSVPD